ncbi:MAG TPA: hypothetical protein EYN67_08545 [Flavobacteriales bacterium]|nr:hypothetical protein [Flavobacteriales bacterium]
MAKYDDDNARVPIKYTARDFASIKSELEDYIRRYYPDTYKDFNEASFGAMMVDTVAYIGDMLSFYLDYSVNELFLDTALEYGNVVKLSRQMGYKFRGKPTAYGEITIYVLIPATVSGLGPDSSYMPIIQKGSQFYDKSGNSFLLAEDIDVSYSRNEVVVATVDAVTGIPTQYAIKATGQIISGLLARQTSAIGSFEKFRRVRLNGSNIAEIISVRDTEGHEYYEVDYLSQNVVYKEIPNRGSNSESVPKIMKAVTVPRRFVVERDKTVTYLQFGYGSDASVTNDNIAEPSRVVMNLHAREYVSSTNFDPTNILKGDKFGVGPSNTKLTVIYRTNGSNNANASADSIVQKGTVRTKFANASKLEKGTMAAVRKSIEITNEAPVRGDVAIPSAQELKRRTIDHFASQGRAVTEKDYTALVYAMPPQFGAITRCRPLQDTNSFKRNINLYIVSEDAKNRLTAANSALKNNLKTWLNRNRMINDSIDVLDAKICNVGIEYSIVVEANQNKFEVLELCNRLLRKRYAKMHDIGEPFYITEVYAILGKIDGVADVVNVEIKKKIDGNYSSIAFNFDDNKTADGRFLACPKNVIFEIKYPSEDIVGSVE